MTNDGDDVELEADRVGAAASPGYAAAPAIGGEVLLRDVLRPPIAHGPRRSLVGSIERTPEASRESGAFRTPGVGAAGSKAASAAGR
jgi:hypothetical protein